jgi:superfamily II helicase
MSEYTVTIEGYETGLTGYTLRKQIENQFPQQDVDVIVQEQ